jgi:hypothetical protein
MAMLGRVAAMWLRGFVIAGVVLLGAACSIGADTTTTTTEALVEITTVPPVETTITTTTLAPLSAPSFPSYSIVQRREDSNGDTVVVLLDPTSYEILSDVDLYDVLVDVVERFPPIVEAHVVDSPAAAQAVLVEEPSDEQLQTLGEHYLVSLEEGFRIVYRGPFADLGTSVLGS